MKPDNHDKQLGCAECAGGAGLGFDFTMAFQPIVNTTTRSIYAHEALARGLNNEPAGKVFEQVNDANCYRFDQSCRTKAIKLASELNMDTFLSINFMPNAVYRPELCIRTTLEAAKIYGFPVDRIIFEITEGEQVKDHAHLLEIVRYYQSQGFKTAIDDFGAGYSGLNLLAEIQTDIIKLDMALIRHIDQDRNRQAIVKAILQLCSELSIIPLAEGIETYEELRVLQSFGLELFQGYYFAKPAFQSLAALTPNAFAGR
ncbi:EAL domain-containing protein [Methylotuvimicrobium sp.]|jgi:EAL domain-containing protein (putative c-di-GMP-specific phosphodiesterase class I)|uniref:EAL domain-containing protein n=1 Tax=Methylotuvimicrobium sp. TaxID=2822413 RepID=UPI003D649857